jgi:hypothetical protein
MQTLKASFDRMLISIGMRHEKGKTPDFHPLTLKIYDEHARKDFLESTAKRKQFKVRFFAAFYVLMTLS